MDDVTRQVGAETLRNNGYSLARSIGRTDNIDYLVTPPGKCCQRGFIKQGWTLKKVNPNIISLYIAGFAVVKCQHNLYRCRGGVICSSEGKVNGGGGSKGVWQGFLKYMSKWRVLILKYFKAENVGKYLRVGFIHTFPPVGRGLGLLRCHPSLYLYNKDYSYVFVFEE